MVTFEQFKEEQFTKDPALRRSSDVFLRRMYEDQVGREEALRIAAQEEEALGAILVTTETVPPYPVLARLDIVTAECVLGINLVQDMLARVTDIVGGRSEATQRELRNARQTALRELRREALTIGANAVIGVSLNYSELSGGGKSMLFLVATGTAVKLDLGQDHHGRG